MKKIGLIVFIAALIVGVVVSNFFAWGKATGEVFNFSFKVGREKGSGHMAAEVRDLRDFKSIDVSSVFEVEVIAQNDFHVEVEADDNLLQYIETEVRNGELQIRLDKSVKTSNPLRVRISAPSIERIEASGASKVKISEVKSPQFEVDTSGASKIELAGETGELIIDVSGASNVNAAALKAENANVDASGASRVSVNVANELRSEASGASSISYSGTPVSVQKKTSGASSVTQR
jgi:hypothetical protein